MKCDKCGAENPDNALHCQECGEKLESNKKQSKSKKKIGKFTKIGLGILGLIVLVVAIMILTSTPGVTDFDKQLIEDVNEGVPGESLIKYIKEFSQIDKDGEKRNYESSVSMYKSTNSTELIDEAKADYEKRLEYIQKDEDARISFVMGEIDEETFKKRLMENYKEYQDTLS